MGLGKTAQLIGSLLADPAAGPTLVVCPVSVLGNWERELAHFAPGLRVLVHHGPARDRGTWPHGPLDADVVLTTYSLSTATSTASPRSPGGGWSSTRPSR